MAKGSPKMTQGAQMGSKDHHMTCNGDQMETQGAQMEPKGVQEVPNRVPRDDLGWILVPKLMLV